MWRIRGCQPVDRAPLKITLKGIRPPIWRRLEVASTTGLHELCAILEAAMGWGGARPGGEESNVMSAAQFGVSTDNPQYGTPMAEQHRLNSLVRFSFSASSLMPRHFEVDVIVAGVRWQYGFDVTDTEVVSEYAYRFPKGRQALVFERDGAHFQFGPSMRSVGRTLEKIIRRNSLLLSVAGATADSELEALFAWFGANLRLAEANNRGIRAARTVELVESAQRERVLAMVRAADLGVTEIRRESADPEFVERTRRSVQILNGVEGDPDGSDADQFVVEDFVRLTHRGPDRCVELDPDEESLGTLVWMVSLVQRGTRLTVATCYWPMSWTRVFTRAVPSNSFGCSRIG